MTRRAGIYTRISLDTTGTRLGVTRQRDTCTRRAHDLGWTIHDVYEDNDVSAYTGVHRPAYERLLADIRNGVIDAVIVWDLDRLTRRPIEIEHFIELADTHHVALASIGGDFDLSTDNGRMFARIKGAVARSEIERRSARQRAANDQRAAAGLPRSSGRRHYGYTQTYETIPAEAEFLHQAADQLLAGTSTRAVTAWLNNAGSLTITGGPWRPNVLRRTMCSPTLAARLTHRGQIVGPGTWEPIFDLDTHAALLARLKDPERTGRGRPPGHLLSGIAACGVCGLSIGGAHGYHARSGKHRDYAVYYCNGRRHLARAAPPVDEYVTEVITRRLARPDALSLLAPTRDQGRINELRTQEAGLRTRLDGLAEAYAAGAIDDLQLRAGTKRIRAELDHASRQVAAAVSNPILTRLLESGDVRAAWEGLVLDERRELLRAFTRIAVFGPGRGARVFDPDKIQISLQRNDAASPSAPSFRAPASS